MFDHDTVSSICESTFSQHKSALWVLQQLLTYSRIDVPRRLRRAILLNDLSLVQRIIRNNPDYLRNPDFEDKSNTNLHLAAKHGFTQIAVCPFEPCAYVISSPQLLGKGIHRVRADKLWQEFLVDAGHEEGNISRNNDFETPLMFAATAGREETGVYLARRFPECIPWQNKAGLDAVCCFHIWQATIANIAQLMLSAKSGSGTLHLIPTLIVQDPTVLTATDKTGNTALHHASAAGELKALRLLLQYGANPLVANAYSWTPVHYSATPAAEAYFKTLIIEFEKKKAEGRRELQERQKQRNAGVRLVTDGDVVGRGSSESERIRIRARDDAGLQGLPAPGMDWSPVEKRRAMTPTEGRGWTFTPDGMRPRAETAESSGTV